MKYADLDWNFPKICCSNCNEKTKCEYTCPRTKTGCRGNCKKTLQERCSLRHGCDKKRTITVHRALHG